MALQDLQKILDNAKNGLILFSLGTNVQPHTLGNDRMQHIFNAFRKLPQYIYLCKFQIDKISIEVPKNVIIRQWIPQNDVLGKFGFSLNSFFFSNKYLLNFISVAHKNTILFITHSGLLSTQEAIYHGVPMLGMPVFCDQFLVSFFI